MRVLIHPGFIKTGTTTLQVGLFGRHPQILNLARPFASHQEEARFSALSRDDLLFDLSTIHAPEDDGRVQVVSVENLARVTRGTSKPGRAEIARRLKELWPEAAILFTIRNQQSAVPSFFSRHRTTLIGAPEPYRGRPVTFENWFRNEAERGLRGGLGMFDYWPVVDVYREVFGPDRVTVLPAEWLFSDPEHFARQLSALLDIPAAEIVPALTGTHANRGPSSRELTLKRIRRVARIAEIALPPRIRTRIERWARAGSRTGRTVVSPDIVAAIEDLYAPGNEHLREASGLPLVELGYPVGDRSPTS